MPFFGLRHSPIPRFPVDRFLWSYLWDMSGVMGPNSISDSSGKTEQGSHSCLGRAGQDVLSAPAVPISFYLPCPGSSRSWARRRWAGCWVDCGAGRAVVGLRTSYVLSRAGTCGSKWWSGSWAVGRVRRAPSRDIRASECTRALTPFLFARPLLFRNPYFGHMWVFPYLLIPTFPSLNS